MAKDKKDEQIELELNLEPLETDKKEEELVIDEVEEAPVEEKKVELTVEDGINELKYKLEQERKAREEAERRAKEAFDAANASKADAHDSNLRLLDNAIETVKRNQEIFKQNLRDAVAAGDADAQAEVMLAISKADNDLRQLEYGKQQYEAQARTPQITDPVEKMASQLTPRSAEWVRAHPEYARDPVMTRRMVRAHEDAIDEGFQADTDDYFNFVETKLKIRKQEAPAQESALSEASAPTQRRSAPPAAPVSRSGSPTSGGRSNVVTLTRMERETAQALGMTDREYAANKQALIKEGKLVG
jgi:flagellar hook-basal body complex protein FliE